MRAFFLVILILVFGNMELRAADLQPETLRAWNANVENVERRIASELGSDRGFLSLDFQNAGEVAKERLEILSGEVSIEQVTGKVQTISVPNGMIHHWRGTIFIPGVSLDLVLSRVADPRLEDARQEDVLDSRILEKQPGQLRLFLKLQRSKLVTVVYNTEHLVQYKRRGKTQAYSSSVATKIAELERGRNGAEREKPEGHDHGYLWRMNSYWRYQEVKGGVIVECESMTLSRSIPYLLEYMIRPLINSVARESMRRTLESFRTRLVQAGKDAGEPPVAALPVMKKNSGRTLTGQGRQPLSSLPNAAFVVVGSISEKATRPPIATAIKSVA